MTQPLSKYMFFEEVDRDRIGGLHDLVTEFRDSFLEDHALQNLLLDQGYELESRPESYHELHNVVFRRTATSINLLYLEHVVDLATRPQNITITVPLIVVPGSDIEDDVEVQTFGGHPADKVEWMQQEWFRQPEIVSAIREYQSTLQKAFDEFNLQFMLGFMFRARAYNLTFEGRESELQAKIKESLGNSPKLTYNPLDNVYYTMGSRFLDGAFPLWESLKETEFGMFFIMMPEEVQEWVHKVRSPGRMHEVTDGED